MSEICFKIKYRSWEVGWGKDETGLAMIELLNLGDGYTGVH